MTKSLTETLTTSLDRLQRNLPRPLFKMLKTIEYGSGLIEDVQLQICSGRRLFLWLYILLQEDPFGFLSRLMCWRIHRQGPYLAYVNACHVRKV